jgi:hypothetical protein
LDYFVGSRQKLVRHGQAYRLRGLEIDDQLELCWLRDRAAILTQRSIQASERTSPQCGMAPTFATPQQYEDLARLTLTRRSHQTVYRYLSPTFAISG